MSTKKVILEFLRVLSDPGPSVTNLDIVAVHGLNASNEETHAMDTWTAPNGKMWLKDFLPIQLPKARIMLFGYNSQVAFNASVNGIDEHAQNLLNRLSQKRVDRNEEQLTRPIIFICHSLGGIIVKQALTMAKLDPTFASIRTSTYGIVFFATPHQGGKFHGLGSIAALIARCSHSKPPSSKLLEALKKDTLYADNIVDDFRFQLEDYHVLTFYETLSYKKEGLIVDQKSATLGLPGTREMQVALDANHFDVCRFEDIAGDDYEQVGDNILSLARNAVKQASAPALVTRRSGW